MSLSLMLGAQAHAENNNSYGHALEAPKAIMTDLQRLDRLGIKTVERDEALGVGVAHVLARDEWKILADSHARNKCAGFMVLDEQDHAGEIFANLRSAQHREAVLMASPLFPRLSVDTVEIETLMGKSSPELLKQQVVWISSYPSRFHRQSDPNVHVRELETRLNRMLMASGLPGSVELIAHGNTNQKTVRLRIEGSQRPDEIIVLGGHFDSISGWGGSGAAPGADDDASGSANVLETARVLLENGKRPERSIEFFWYAGEEGGLLGSKEIARTYSQQRKNVIAVLQLDMTLFPGNGEFVIGNITDNTNAWLRDYYKLVNEKYLKVRMVDDRCGYGCSDHASWHQNGFAAFLPFEATKDTMNSNIHTARDTIDARSNFPHAHVFTKLAIAYTWDMANSTQRPQ